MRPNWPKLASLTWKPDVSLFRFFMCVAVKGNSFQNLFIVITYWICYEDILQKKKKKKKNDHFNFSQTASLNIPPKRLYFFSVYLRW